MTRIAKTNPTLKDVAQAAGCSTAVVSTVVNSAKGNTLVSQAMQRRVRETAQRLGYRANFASRSLARRSTQTVGVYVPPGQWAGLGMRYESAIVQGVERACREHGYDMLAINLAGGERPDICSQRFAEQRIDGLILLHVESDADWLEPLLAQSPNVAAVNYYGQAPVDRVNFDDRTAMRIAVEHLITLGHRHIAYVGSCRESLGPGAALRHEGYQDAMRDAGLAIHPQWVWDMGNRRLIPRGRGDRARHDAGAAADHLLALGADMPTAAVAYDDLIAIHLMRRLQMSGVAVPHDMCVVGIDGSDLGELALPELTSVQQPFAAMGSLATKWVIDRTTTDGEATPRYPRIQLAQPRLIERASTVWSGGRE